MVCQHILFLVVIIAEPGEYNIQYTCLVYILEELCILVCVYYCKRDGCYEKPHYNGEFTLFKQYFLFCEKKNLCFVQEELRVYSEMDEERKTNGDREREELLLQVNNTGYS